MYMRPPVEPYGVLDWPKFVAIEALGRATSQQTLHRAEESKVCCSRRPIATPHRPSSSTSPSSIPVHVVAVIARLARGAEV